MEGIRLSDIFTPQKIKLRIQGTDKDEVLEELVDFLVRVYKVKTRDEILAAIREREEKMTTGLKKGIAIPHAKIDSAGPIIAIAGVSEQGIDFNSLDNNPVHIVFLFVSDKENHQTHLEFLGKLSGIIEAKGFYDDVMSAQSELSISEIIRQYENKIDMNS